MRWIAIMAAAAFSAPAVADGKVGRTEEHKCVCTMGVDSPAAIAARAEAQASIGEADLARAQAQIERAQARIEKAQLQMEMDVQAVADLHSGPHRKDVRRIVIRRDGSGDAKVSEFPEGRNRNVMVFVHRDEKGDKADANRDGRITRREFRRAMDEAFAKLDRDGDGVVSRGEMVARDGLQRLNMFVTPPSPPEPPSPPTPPEPPEPPEPPSSPTPPAG